MKKNKKIISLTAAAALLCVGGAFALNANTTVSADTESKQIMLGASVLLDGVVDTGDTGIIRFPVIVKDEVAAQIVESKIYVLPQEFWGQETAPTAEEIMAHEKKFEGITKNAEIDKWVDYYEDIEGEPYGTDYEQAVVYMKNIPAEQFANNFHVCSWMKLNDETEDVSKVASRSMEYVAAAAVNSGDYTLDRVEKYLTETEYTVTPYLRTIYGSYKAEEPQTVTGYKGIKANFEDVTVDNGTRNDTLTAQANADLTATEDATFNVYYENDAYQFETLVPYAYDTTDVSLSLKEQAMTGVDAANLRGNTYYYKKTVADANTQLYFHYDADDVGKYLVLNTYYTKMGSASGFQLFDAKNGTNMSNVWHYDENGKMILINNGTLTNKWVSIVVYLDETRFPKDKDSFSISFFHYQANELYFGESILLTKEQFEDNYDPTSLATDIIGYNSLSLVKVWAEQRALLTSTFETGIRTVTFNSTTNQGPTHAYDGNQVKINGVASYAAGSYVAIRMRYNRTGHLKMYSNPAKEIYTDDGTRVAGSLLANTWHTFVFYVANDTAVGNYSGNFYVDDWNFGLVIEYAEVYVIANETAYTEFKNIKGFISSEPIAYNSSNIQKSGISGANNANIALNSDGYMVYTTTADLFYNRGIKLLSSYTKGQYVAMEIYSDDFALNAAHREFWGSTEVGMYDKETKQLVDNADVTTGKWYIAVWSINNDITSIGQWSGQIAFWDSTNNVGNQVLIGTSYVFTNEAAFNAWIGA